MRHLKTQNSYEERCGKKNWECMYSAMSPADNWHEVVVLKKLQWLLLLLKTVLRDLCEVEDPLRRAAVLFLYFHFKKKPPFPVEGDCLSTGRRWKWKWQRASPEGRKEGVCVVIPETWFHKKGKKESYPLFPPVPESMKKERKSFSTTVERLFLTPKKRATEL